jgi:uncharacterized iron-regulated protein
MQRLVRYACVGVAASLALAAPAPAADNPGAPNGCHASVLHFVKVLNSETSTAATAADVGASVQELQKSIDALCQQPTG